MQTSVKSTQMLSFVSGNRMYRLTWQQLQAFMYWLEPPQRRRLDLHTRVLYSESAEDCRFRTELLFRLCLLIGRRLSRLVIPWKMTSTPVSRERPWIIQRRYLHPRDLLREMMEEGLKPLKIEALDNDPRGPLLSATFFDEHRDSGALTKEAFESFIRRAFAPRPDDPAPLVSINGEAPHPLSDKEFQDYIASFSERRTEELRLRTEFERKVHEPFSSLVYELTWNRFEPLDFLLSQRRTEFSLENNDALFRAHFSRPAEKRIIGRMPPLSWHPVNPPLEWDGSPVKEPEGPALSRDEILDSAEMPRMKYFHGVFRPIEDDASFFNKLVDDAKRRIAEEKATPRLVNEWLAVEYGSGALKDRLIVWSASLIERLRALFSKSDGPQA